MACAWSVPSHYLNQCWDIVNWTLRNKLQWNLNRNLYISIETWTKRFIISTRNFQMFYFDNSSFYSNSIEIWWWGPVPQFVIGQHSLKWRHSERDGVSNHYPHDCLLVYPRRRSKKHQSSASLDFVRGIHRWVVNSPHKGPVTRKMFQFDDFSMALGSISLPKGRKSISGFDIH